VRVWQYLKEYAEWSHRIIVLFIFCGPVLAIAALVQGQWLLAFIGAVVCVLGLRDYRRWRWNTMHGFYERRPPPKLE
jgi:hypothetical protein